MFFHSLNMEKVIGVRSQCMLYTYVKCERLILWRMSCTESQYIMAVSYVKDFFGPTTYVFIFLLVLVKYLLPVFSLIAIYPFPGGYPSVTSEAQKFDLGAKISMIFTNTLASHKYDKFKGRRIFS